MPTSTLRKADWNYKLDGTEEDIQKLMRSIRRDKSAGVLAVRELDDGTFEVMDGNHRLEAIRRLEWDEVKVENFGPISQAEAVLIARRRNHNWFKDDAIQLSTLMRDVVVPEISIDEMETFVPESREEIQAMIDMASTFTFDEEEPEQEEEMSDPSDWGVRSRFSMPKDAFDVFMQAYKMVEEKVQAMGLKLHKDKDVAFGQVIEVMSAEYLAGPDDSGLVRIFDVPEPGRELN